jgi:uncharacterized membrane protein YfcA
MGDSAGDGVPIGLLAGLLGVGGGVVAVPVLPEIFEVLGVVEPVALTVGTTQAGILIASATAAAHWRAGTVDRALARTPLRGLFGAIPFSLWVHSPHL